MSTHNAEIEPGAIPGRPLVLSKTKQAERLILGGIVRGDFPLAQRIPSETCLTKSMAVSRITIRRAIGSLVADGILESQPGVGHLVRARHRSATIGVLCGHAFLSVEGLPFHRLILEAMQPLFNAHHYRSEPYAARLAGEAHIGERDRFLRQLTRGRLRAVFTLAWPCAENENPEQATQDLALMAAIQKAGVPLVSVTEEAVPGAIGTDAYSVGYLGARHFLDAGLRRIGLLVGERHSSFHIAVQRGWADAMAEREMGHDSAWTHFVDDPSSEARCYAAFREWRPDVLGLEAILIGDDFLAKGAMTAAMELGIAVPTQLQFGTFAVRGSNLFFPRPCARLEIDPAAFAAEAAHRLKTLIEDPTLALDPIYL